MLIATLTTRLLYLPEQLVPQNSLAKNSLVPPDLPPSASKLMVTRSRVKCSDVVISGRKGGEPGSPSMGVYRDWSWSEDTQTPVYRRVMGVMGTVSLAARFLFYDGKLHAWVVGLTELAKPPYKLRLNSEGSIPASASLLPTNMFPSPHMVDLTSNVPISTDSWHVWGDFFTSNIISTCVTPPSFPPSAAPTSEPSVAPSPATASAPAPANAPWYVLLAFV